MPSISSPLIQWRNFRLTPLELLIIVFTILGVIFLVSTWNRDNGHGGQYTVNTATAWEQATAASEHTAQMVGQMREEIALLQATVQSLEKRLQAFEKGAPVASQAPANASSNAAPLAPAAPANVALYTVKAGDTLNSIARANNISVVNLRAWNKLDANSKLKVGQKLRLTNGN